MNPEDPYVAPARAQADVDALGAKSKSMTNTTTTWKSELDTRNPEFDLFSRARVDLESAPRSLKRSIMEGVRASQNLCSIICATSYNTRQDILHMSHINEHP